MADWDVEVVRRTPTSAGPPTRAVVGTLTAAQTIKATVELNGPGAISVTCSPRTLTTAVTDRLRDLDSAPCEVNVLRDGVLHAAGPVLACQVNGQALTVTAARYPIALAYMQVGPGTGDLTYTAVDQHTIAANLIDAWQALTFADWDIDTTAVGASGVTRDRTYLQVEPADLLHLISLLGEVADGFDWDIDDLCVLRAWSPERGTDLSASVILDARCVVNPAESVSVAPGEFCSDAYAVAETATGAPTVQDAITAGVRSAFGRAAISARVDSVGTTKTGQKAQRLRNTHNTQLLGLGFTVTPIPGATPRQDFDVGDTVHYEMDAGLGLRSVDRRVQAITTTVNGGTETYVVVLA